MTDPNSKQPSERVAPGGVDSVDAVNDDGSASASMEETIIGYVEHSQSDLGKSLGRYEIRGRLGEGAFGTVYVGFDTQLNRQVAIKVPKTDKLNSSGSVEKFLLEARQVARLEHPGIVTVYDVGEQDGSCYIVSALVKGVSLTTWLRDHAPDWRQSTEIVAGIADALSHAHRHSTVHRDIKPSNIMLTGDLQPVLLDFGLAVSDETKTLKERGSAAGTPAYMSPEQAAGRGHRIDGRTDIFSLGVVLYQMLCGKKPFRANNVPELLRQVLCDEPQPPRQLVPDIPVRLERICLKAMAKDQAQRYMTAADMADELRALLKSEEGVPRVAAPSPVVGSAPDPKPSAATDSRTSRTSSSIRRIREEERRQVTVLHCFCDPDDPEQSMDSMDPELQVDVLREFQRVCDEAVKKHGGTVVQSTGQGLLICFGYPIAWEDAAQRGIRAGLQILHEVRRDDDWLRKKFGLQLNYWISLHTGLAIAGDRVDSVSLVGEARNVATRLESVIDPNQVVITGATHRLVENMFVFEPLGRQSLRGVSEPLELFRVVEARRLRNRVDLVQPQDLTPLIGRDTELSILRDRWEQAIEGMGQVVLLIGDAGLGKSRLVREIRDFLSKQDESQPIIEWRCSQYHQQSSLYSAGEFFERLLDFRREDTATQKQEKLVRHLEDYNLSSAVNVALFASLLSVPLDNHYPPLQLSPQRMKEQTQEVLLDWLREYAAAQPVLFIVEDLHWIDPSGLELLGKHLEQGFNDRILTLLTFRPEFETPWGSRAHQTQIALSRLTKKQIGEMMHRKSGASKIPAELIAQVVDRTDGVPLFVEEFTKLIVESGALQGPAPESKLLDRIPASLNDLLMARLDRMDSDPDVVQMSATLGREFTYELLNAVLDLPEDDLQAELGKLVQSELLFQKGRPPQCQYIFKHALIQDAAYNSLLLKKRQKFHKKIAEVLESQFPETAESQPEVLAKHFTEAGTAEPAIRYWMKAGQRSLARSANAEACDQFRRGLELVAMLDESPERDALELGFQAQYGVALLSSRGYAYPEVGPIFERARELCKRVGDPVSLFHIMWGIWAWRLVRGEQDIGVGLANEILEYAEAQEDPGIRCEAQHVGLTWFYRGEFSRAAETFRRGMDRIDPQRCLFHAAHTGQNFSVTNRCYLGLTLWHLGYPEQAIQMTTDAVALAHEIGHPVSIAYALHHHGWLYQHCRIGREAQRVSEQCIKLSTEHSLIFWIGCATLNRGSAIVQQDRVTKKTVEEILGALDLIHATGTGLNLPPYYGYLATAHWKLGHFDEALESLDKAFEAVERLSERFYEAELHRYRGEILLSQSPDAPDAAEVCFRKAIEVARGQKAQSWELRAAVSLHRLRQRQGNSEQSRQMLAEVFGRFTEGFETPDLLEARQLLEN